MPVRKVSRNEDDARKRLIRLLARIINRSIDQDSAAATADRHPKKATKC